MHYADFSSLVVERQGPVLTITLNRGDALNAIDHALHRELADIFGLVALDDEAKVVVLTGAGTAFSAGGDFGLMQNIIDDPRQHDIEGSALSRRLLLAILECPKPIVARLNGDAVGLGATIALFCDMIVAVDSARIGDPHVKVGLVAGDGGAIIWPHLIGHCRASEFLLLGTLVAAPEAARIGLINYSLPAGELDGKVKEISEKLSQGALLAIRWTKAALKAPLKRAVTDYLDASLAHEGVTMRSADHQEAVAAFRERRRPVFSGR